MVGKPIFIVPYLYDINLPEEDGLGVERRLANENKYSIHHKIENDDSSIENRNDKKIKKSVVVVVAYPHVSITDDLTPLETDPRFRVEWRRKELPQIYPHTTCIILPGSRLSLRDLIWLTEETEWGICIKNHVKAGGHVLGLCGGYQMLGMVLDDAMGVEGTKGIQNGLGLLPVETKIEAPKCKVVKPQAATLLKYDYEQNDLILNETEGVSVEGFELHCGQTKIVKQYLNGEKALPLIRICDENRNGEIKEEGIRCGNIKGSYLHGILKTAAARRMLLCNETSGDSVTMEGEDKMDNSMDPLDRLATHLEDCGLDFVCLSRLAGVN